MNHKDQVASLNEVIQRLISENAQTRQKVEEVEALIRRRATNADGLSLAAAVKTILDDRDAAGTRITIFRAELKKALTLLLADNAKEAVKAINHFLFHNPR